MALTVTKPTELTITPLSGRAGFTLPDYAGRNLRQTLDKLADISGTGGLGKTLRRDVNGNMMDLTYKAFQKYGSVITYREQIPPAFDQGWLGEVCQVDCAIELWYLTGETPQRPSVPGSTTRTEGAYTIYRPSLLMMVVDTRNEFEEYTAIYNCMIAFQEL